MPVDLNLPLEKYAQLIVKIGLNVQSGQQLLIQAPVASASLVRCIAASAYQVGAEFVDVMWNDVELDRVRLQHAPRDTFDVFPGWQVQGRLENAQHGGAMLTIVGQDPDAFEGQNLESITQMQRTAQQRLKPVYDYTMTQTINWCVVPFAGAGWAAKAFPDEASDRQVNALWNMLFEICRINHNDPLDAWHRHIDHLLARREALTQKRYAALRFTGPGTDLHIGLPEAHAWKGGQATTKSGITFTPNLPTEEVLTLPHRERTEGVVSATKPLSYAGTVIERFSLTFQKGRVVEVNAGRGADILRKLIDTDDGAGRLGEVALVPHSSPISQTNKMFYNTLIDENAAHHIALGRAYRACLEGGTTMSSKAFQAAGGNDSAVHVDFMIGSEEVDVDGLLANGVADPIMRDGEWAFDVS